MKTLKEYITINEASTDFPSNNAWKKKDGIVSMSWKCGNDMAKEYLNSAENSYDSKVSLWFKRNIDRIDTITLSIYDSDNGIKSHIYFDINNVGGRAIKFKGSFNSIKDAKNDMYELLCKIRDDKDIFRKISENDSDDYLSYDEMINL